MTVFIFLINLIAVITADTLSMHHTQTRAYYVSDSLKACVGYVILTEENSEASVVLLGCEVNDRNKVIYYKSEPVQAHIKDGKIKFDVNKFTFSYSEFPVTDAIAPGLNANNSVDVGDIPFIYKHKLYYSGEIDPSRIVISRISDLYDSRVDGPVEYIRTN